MIMPLADRRPRAFRQFPSRLPILEPMPMCAMGIYRIFAIRATAYLILSTGTVRANLT